MIDISSTAKFNLDKLNQDTEVKAPQPIGCTLNLGILHNGLRIKSDVELKTAARNVSRSMGQNEYPAKEL